MPLNYQTLFFILLVFAIWASIETYKVRTRVHCEFIGADKAEISKWVKFKQRRTTYDGGWYYLNPKRIITKVLDKGFPWVFFPTKVQCLKFRWDSSQPLNPEDFSVTWETPQARANLNKEEDIRAYAEGGRVALGGKQKQGFLQQYQGLIIVIGFVIVAYLLWAMTKKIDTIGLQGNIMQQQLQNLQKLIGR